MSIRAAAVAGEMAQRESQFRLTGHSEADQSIGLTVSIIDPRQRRDRSCVPFRRVDDD